MTTFKFELPDGTLRRVTLTKEDATVAGLRARVLRDMVSVPDVALSYVDGEDEVVAIVTEGDLAEAVAAFEKQGKAVKIRVGQQQQPQQQQQQQPEEEEEPEPEPEPTLDVKLARALANPTTVQAFHLHLAESTALAQQVAAVADAYLQGGLMEAKDAAVEAAPVLRAVVLEAANNTDPLFGEAVQEVADAMPPTVPPFFFHHPPPFMSAPFFQHAFRAWGGGEGPFGGCVPPPPPFAPGQPSPPPQPPHQHAGVHPFIVCDACEADEDLKKASKMAGNVSVRGWIVGPRHHSTKIQDFDLCASCYNTGRFNPTHGPFDVMQPKMAFGPNHFHPHPHHQHHGHRHGGCHPGRFGGPRGCRGSGRQNFADVIAETIGRAASAVAQSADTSAELAQVAKAISESLASSQQQQQQAQQQAQQQQQQQQQQPGVQKMPAQAPEAKRETSSATTTTTNSSDKAHSDDEWTVEEVADPMVRWREQLQRLHDVGFTESEKYIELLEQEKGDLERVINILVRRAA